MKEPGGYHSQYLIHQLTRTDNRADYSSDAVFANFRSSPVNNDLGRAAYADVLAKASGIQAVMNLVDSDALIGRHIAQKLYGTGTRWPELYEANRTSIRDPNQIQIGQVLTVPAV